MGCNQSCKRYRPIRIPYGIFSPKWEAGLAFLLCGALRSFKKLSLAIALPVESAITSIYWPIIILNPKLSPKLDGFFLISNKNFSTKDPYPFLNDVNFPIRLAIYTGASGLCYMYASIAEGLHGFFINLSSIRLVMYIIVYREIS
ncbi:hypothetical protein H4Q26_009083 [Puccinia striiformis f. sp. tritici PST-130]|nr:hypothetical protein H4Q26_009083 [Puccinia striiformis f. sp. tritici PST-130]